MWCTLLHVCISCQCHLTGNMLVHTFCSNWPGVLKCIQAGFPKLSLYSSGYYIPHFSSCVYLSAKPSFLLMREMCTMLRIIVMLDFGPSEDIHGN